MKNIIIAFVALSIACAAGVARAAKLEAGSVPPPIKVLQWIKGEPVTEFAAGKVYVVEFWATWCPPCRQSIPHLTELARKYKGKITFAGIDVWDVRDEKTVDEYVAKVSKFVQGQGAKMEYSVGLDDMAGTMASTWMKAAGQNGIPAAFVIGADGKIAAICHPMGLDKILSEIAGSISSSDTPAPEKAEDIALTALMSAAAKGDSEKVKTILKDHPELITAKDKDGATALHFAAQSGSVGVLDVMIASKGDVTARKNDGVTPLHVAASLGRLEAVKRLMAAGSDPKAEDSKGRTPISLAKNKGFTDIVNALTATESENSTK